MIDNNAIADALENCDWSDTSIGTKGILLVAIDALRATPSYPVERRPAPVGLPGPLPWSLNTEHTDPWVQDATGTLMFSTIGMSEAQARSFLSWINAAASHPPRQDDAREGEIVEPPSKLDLNWRSRCKELWQKLGRDQMLRQGDPVETLMEFYNEVWIEGRQKGDNTPIPSLAELTPLDTTPPAPDEAHTISMSFATYEEAIAEAEARGRAGSKGTGEPPALDETLNWQVEKAVEAEREACAELAASYGPSRPVLKKDPDDIIKARWEGEQAASIGISRLILARGAFDKRTLRQVLENELIDAVDFFDKVRASTQEEQVAVGQDHYNRLDIAVRKLVSFLRPKK